MYSVVDFFKCRDNLGWFNIPGTFSSLFKWNSPQKQRELTKCFFIIISLVLLHLTDGKKNLLHQSLFPMSATPDSSRSMSENPSDGRFIMNHWEGKKKKIGKMVFGAKFWYKPFCAKMLLSRQWKLGFINIFQAPKKERYLIKRMKNVIMCLRTCTDAYEHSQPVTVLDCFRITYLHWDGP